MSKRLLSVLFALTMICTTLGMQLDISAAGTGEFFATGTLGGSDGFGSGNSTVTLTAGSYNVKGNGKAIYVKKKSASDWTKISKDKATSLLTDGSWIYYSKIDAQNKSEGWITKCSVYKINMQGKKKQLIFTAEDDYLGLFPGLTLVAKYKNTLYYGVGPMPSNGNSLYSFNETTKKTTFSEAKTGKGFYYNGKIYLRPADQATLVNTSTKYFSVKKPNEVKTFKNGVVTEPFYNKTGVLWFYSYKWKDDMSSRTKKYFYYFSGGELKKSEKLPNKYEPTGSADSAVKYVIVRDSSKTNYKFYLATGKLKKVAS